MRRFLLIVSLLAVAVVAAGFKTRVPETEYVRKLAARELTIPCEFFSERPAADLSLGICRIDRPAVLRGVELVVGRRFGSSGNTSLHLDLNGTTVVSSTVSVASHFGGTLSGRATAALDRQLNVGDIVHVRIGAVTAGAASAQVAGKAVIVERF